MFSPFHSIKRFEKDENECPANSPGIVIPKRTELNSSGFHPGSCLLAPQRSTNATPWVIGRTPFELDVLLLLIPPSELTFHALLELLTQRDQKLELTFLQTTTYIKMLVNFLLIWFLNFRFENDRGVSIFLGFKTFEIFTNSDIYYNTIFIGVQHTRHWF